MAETIGQWIGVLPSWVQLVVIPIFLILALLFVPIGAGDNLAMMLIEFMTRKTGVKNDKK